MIKYLGSKRTLLPGILEAVASMPGVRRVVDLFSGTSRVGHALKARGYDVVANDHNAYAHTLAMCYVQADARRWTGPAQLLIEELNRVGRAIQPSGVNGTIPADLASAPLHPLTSSPPGPDPFTRTYCLESRFFHPENGPRIFAVREAIREKGLEPELEAVVLTALMEAADRVDSTTGVQMAYLKSWAPRALKPLELRLPRLVEGPGLAVSLDAAEAARRYAPEADAVYVDPPYNQHSYLGNYHIWESLVRWDFPAVYGTARKREDVRTRRSAFNSRRGCLPALGELLEAVPRDRALIVSFSDEGFLSREEMEGLLAGRGRVRVVEQDYKRYVGAQIGIYNPRGEKVGRVSHLRNKELLFVVAP
jgi:adenine-specific DNA-methyltransferase